MIHLKPYIDAAIAHLEGEDDRGLPAALARQNAFYPAELEVPRPVKITDGTEDPLDAFTGPWIEVAAPTWRMSNASLGQLVYDLDIQIVVSGRLEDPRAGTLNKRLQILGAALLDSLIQPRAFGDGVVNEVSGSYPINLVTGEKEYYRGAAILIFTLSVGESREPIPEL
jgi:hypothetical protein